MLLLVEVVLVVGALEMMDMVEEVLEHIEPEQHQ